ncbi:hypothetical protein K9857_19975 [Pseudomonas sp. REP124]|uniref:hypothetical protein n=1 Tax=Pseudomonas sp. REP124 TaxID=2875731 RepID=UPI001CCD6C84|nr:hypothetical protein [Pseudomonas sp. REP124]MBZ9783815.1 hypothetical protein [Pseudomonas sp. REP124]
MLAMVVNDDADSLTPSGASDYIASKLAPTEKGVASDKSYIFLRDFSLVFAAFACSSRVRQVRRTHSLTFITAVSDEN